MDKKKFIPEAPSNQSTTLHYELTELALVDIIFTDIAGNIVRRDTGGAVMKDRGSFTWDGKNSMGQYVSDGSYLIRKLPIPWATGIKPQQALLKTRLRQT